MYNSPVLSTEMTRMTPYTVCVEVVILTTVATLPLHRACWYNHPHCADCVIKWGASLSMTDDGGNTQPQYD